MTEDRYRWWLMAVVLAGAALRLAGLAWDEGRLLHPDEGNLVRAALELGPGGRWIPEFHAYNDLALWLPRALSLVFCAPQEAGCLSLAARLVSALAAIAAIPVAAGLARTLCDSGSGRTGGRTAGLAAAALIAFSAPLIQWAHFGTTESALVLQVLALWHVAALWLDGRLSDRRMALISGAILGLGFGFKTTAAVLSVIPLAALILGGRPDARRLRTMAAGAVLAVAFALVSTPSLVFATADWLEVMRFEGGVVTGDVPVFWTRQFHGATDGLFEVAQLWSATAWVGLLLALGGLAALPRVSRPLAAPGLLLALVYAALTFGWEAKFFRYLAPLVPLVLILAAVALGVLVEGRAGRTLRMAGLCAAGLMALQGLEQASIYLRPDPRIAAEAALLSRARPEDIIAIEPHDLAQTGGLATQVLPLTDPAPTAPALAAVLAEVDWLVIASRRNWEVLPRQPGAAPEICATYAGLVSGTLGYAVAGRFTRDGLFGRLFAPGLAAEETRVVFDRPEVILLRNIDRLPEAEVAARLAAPIDPSACAPASLAAGWSLPR